jgi:hypothetical protein
MPAKSYRIKLSEDERLELETLRDRGSQKTKSFKKILALLLCDEGPAGPALSDAEIRPVVAMSPSSVSGVPSAIRRHLRWWIHSCHSLQIYDTYERISIKDR